ncbi:multiple antibiotic resistance protein [Cricetibacter osteomyelitidis]|uniref:UPF0056 membrane protein n=1 Tax=Cricetibacter osteomyelitidis TaxID=1521931 RepID=A0A4V6NS75_9PAST|nr:MarC family protein [Cricetibacter osteomyelitidis]TCP94883.1 multiple antibiotic resistance protein [Cricetibacter osteomyelitidis]
MLQLDVFGMAFMAFFAIMNPVSSLPIYLSITEQEDNDTARLVARKGLFVAFLIVAAFSLSGKLIFEIFGMTMPALRLAGGVIVFLIGLQMLQGGQNSTVTHPINPESAVKNREDVLGVAISPLATPMLAGPGTIATAMNLSADASFVNVIVTIMAFAVLCLSTYVLFLYGKRIVKLLGKSAMRVMTRMMGLILAVIGTQMIINGIYDAFPMLKS